jgi:hypothetical protein
VTNAVTGKSLPTIGVRNITTDLLTGETKSTATNVHIVVPAKELFSLPQDSSRSMETATW